MRLAHLRCSANYLRGEAMCELCELLLGPEEDDDEAEQDEGHESPEVTGTEDTPGLLPTPIVRFVEPSA